MADSELVLVEPQIRGVAYPEELIHVTKAYLLEARAKSTREAYELTSRMPANSPCAPVVILYGVVQWAKPIGTAGVARDHRGLVGRWRQGSGSENLVREQQSIRR